MQSERERIALVIQMIVVLYRDALARDDSGVRDGYRHRASSVLDDLDAAAQPFPDLQDSLSAARAELELT